MAKSNQGERITYNLFIGKSKDWEYIFLEEAFSYGKNWLSGLTWSVFEFLTQWDLDKRIDDYDWMELRKDAVYYWNWTEWYNDWVEEIKDNWDAEMTVRDDSYYNKQWLKDAMDVARQNEEIDYEYSDCRGGWRIFEHEMLSEDYYEYHIPDNLKTLRNLYYKYEE